jgi:ubiquinone/menaquinone biosynthesis C-methylase UbiE
MAERAWSAGAAAPFDAAAADYDRSFAHTLLGRCLRERVWERIAASFPAGGRILELGSGTGEDAVWLARRGFAVTATDASANMLDATHAKAERAGVAERIELRRVDWSAQELPSFDAAPFDGALANFGVVNCIADRIALAGRLAALLRPRGRAVIVAMGRACLWEIAWRLAHGEVRGAFRRFDSPATARLPGGGALSVWYPPPARLAADFAPRFDAVETIALGSFLPPTDLAPLVEHRPRAFAALAALDRRFSRARLAIHLADHYVSVFERSER